MVLAKNLFLPNHQVPTDMDAIFKKLNYKSQPTVHVLNAPDSFTTSLQSIQPTANTKFEVEAGDEVEFALVFATKQSEVDTAVHLIGPRLKGDAIFWVAYPKGTSKKYKCEFNRDNGWTAMGQYGLKGVRMVAIDEDWSVFRFRKVEFIKTSPGK
jgi:hypothetical protein